MVREWHAGAALLVLGANMKQEFSDELISAYLDGELTAQEQLLVEQTIREQANYRQMFEELRALRSTLQSLPRHEPEEDLTPRVLRSAERQMLTRVRPEERRGDSSGGSSLDAVPVEAPHDQRKRWRRIVWAATALAASILFAMFLPHFRGGTELGDVALDKNSDASRAAGERPLPALTASPQLSAAPDAGLDNKYEGESLTSKPERLGTAAGSRGVPSPEAPRAGDAAPDVANFQSFSIQMPAPPAASSAETAPAEAAAPAGTATRFGATGGFGGEDLQVERLVELLERQIVVRCVLPPNPDPKEPVEAALNRNQIAVSDFQSSDDESQDDTATSSQLEGARFGKLHAPPEADLFLVDASLSQIRGTLEDLSRQGVRVAVDSPDVKGLEKYFRGPAEKAKGPAPEASAPSPVPSRSDTRSFADKDSRKEAAPAAGKSDSGSAGRPEPVRSKNAAPVADETRVPSAAGRATESPPAATPESETRRPADAAETDSTAKPDVQDMQHGFAYRLRTAREVADRTRDEPQQDMVERQRALERQLAELNDASFFARRTNQPQTVRLLLIVEPAPAAPAASGRALQKVIPP